MSLFLKRLKYYQSREHIAFVKSIVLFSLLITLMIPRYIS